MKAINATEIISKNVGRSFINRERVDFVFITPPEDGKGSWMLAVHAGAASIAFMFDSEEEAIEQAAQILGYHPDNARGKIAKVNRNERPEAPPAPTDFRPMNVSDLSGRNGPPSPEGKKSAKPGEPPRLPKDALKSISS